jgi:hypothetical protein
MTEVWGKMSYRKLQESRQAYKVRIILVPNTRKEADQSCKTPNIKCNGMNYAQAIMTSETSTVAHVPIREIAD